MLTEQDVLDRFRAAIDAAGSQAAFARQHGVSLQYVNDVIRGRRDIGQKILAVLGVERVVLYRLIDSVDDSRSVKTPRDDRTPEP